MSLPCPSCAAPFPAGAPACPACGRAPTTLAPGSVVASRFELSTLLDGGGAGHVYRAFDRRSEQNVALKVFRTDLPSNAAAVRHFRAHIGTARGVVHPNLCPILDHGEEGPLAYVSLEILAGEDLGKTMKAHPQGLPEAEALSGTLQIASGLQAIHDAKVVHADLKTAQAVRDESGIVRIVPFGVMKDPLSLGDFVGTPQYMSPEQCWGYELDTRSDIYVLGIIAFELFTGMVPFRGEDAMDTLFRQMRETPKFDRDPGSRIPPPFVPILRRALEKAASDRFASVQELVQAFRAIAPDSGAAIPPARSPHSVASPAPAAILPPLPAAPPPPPAPPPQAPASAKTYGETRRDERFVLPTDVRIRKLGPDGTPVKEERTVADDLSRSGMRVLTSWSDLEQGDNVSIEEVGGNFSTGAIVRHVNRGADQITRVGLQFVQKQAPDRLVGTSTGILQPAFDTSRSYPGSASGGSSPISPLGGSQPVPRHETAPSIPRPVFARVPTVPIPSHGQGNQPPSVPADPPPPRENVAEEVAMLTATARGLIAESKIWEALESLSKAQALADGTPEAHGVRILTWETQAKVPSLMREAQQNLEDIARNDPRDVAVQSALGRIFWEAGLPARARVAFQRVIALEPSNREATVALAVLNDPTRRK